MDSAGHQSGGYSFALAVACLTMDCVEEVGAFYYGFGYREGNIQRMRLELEILGRIGITDKGESHLPAGGVHKEYLQKVSVSHVLCKRV